MLKAVHNINSAAAIPTILTPALTVSLATKLVIAINPANAPIIDIKTKIDLPEGFCLSIFSSALANIPIDTAIANIVKALDLVCGAVFDNKLIAAIKPNIIVKTTAKL